METDYFRFQEVVQGTEPYERYLEFRHEVFCQELQRIQADEFPVSSNGLPMETDQYDPHSRHFTAYHKLTGEFGAFVRVILPSEVGLNVTPRYVIDRPLPFDDATDANIGEISRMAIAPRFRRRHEDQDKPFQGDPEPEMSFRQEGHRRHQPELVLGLYREIYHLCKSVGIHYCVAAMDNRFSRLLNTLGFPFRPVGPVNESVQPNRRVFMISDAEMEHSLGSRESRLLGFMQEALRASG